MVEYFRHMKSVVVIGGGLAGSEAAWQIAQAGIHVDLYEMRPIVSTGAHFTDYLSELVCSNSLGSNRKNKASGLLKLELQMLNSLLVDCAERSKLPAGTALAVDRMQFAKSVTDAITSHPNINLHREELTKIPAGPTIIATGPLTSQRLTESIQAFTGIDSLYFFDAISPSVETSSINMNVAFYASRYQFDLDSSQDYINCPLDEAQYLNFVKELQNAETIPLRQFESDITTGVKTAFFEACLPIEILAKRNPQSLSFGPMRPVGIHNPHSQEKPHAVVQLRRDDLAGSSFNLVGFQTNLTYPEQQRVFHLIPGLEKAKFTRFGQMHRNTYVNSPLVLYPTLQTRSRHDLFFAGQIAGIEGYMGNIASGLLAGINISRYLQEKPLIKFPELTMIGALHHHISDTETKDFQPIKANFGILPSINNLPRSRDQRRAFYSDRSISSLKEYILENDLGIE